MWSQSHPLACMRVTQVNFLFLSLLFYFTFCMSNMIALATHAAEVGPVACALTWLKRVADMSVSRE